MFSKGLSEVARSGIFPGEFYPTFAVILINPYSGMFLWIVFSFLLILSFRFGTAGRMGLSEV